MIRHMEAVHHRMGHPVLAEHIPPHEREHGIYAAFEESDRETFFEVFQDEDTAEAAMDIIFHAPPEIQVLTFQILKLIEEAE